jgi:hypothetical protein
VNIANAHKAKHSEELGYGFCARLCAWIDAKVRIPQTPQNHLIKTPLSLASTTTSPTTIPSYPFLIIIISGTGTMLRVKLSQKSRPESSSERVDNAVPFIRQSLPAKPQPSSKSILLLLVNVLWAKQDQERL